MDSIAAIEHQISLWAAEIRSTHQATSGLRKTDLQERLWAPKDGTDQALAADIAYRAVRGVGLEVGEEIVRLVSPAMVQGAAPARGVWSPSRRPTTVAVVTNRRIIWAEKTPGCVLGSKVFDLGSLAERPRVAFSSERVTSLEWDGWWSAYKEHQECDLSCFTTHGAPKANWLLTVADFRTVEGGGAAFVARHFVRDVGRPHERGHDVPLERVVDLAPSPNVLMLAAAVEAAAQLSQGDTRNSGGSPTLEPVHQAEFESVESHVQRWMHAHGCPDATLTNSGADGGVDIRSHVVVAQVKAATEAVSVAVVQRTYGIATFERRHAMVFAGRFSPSAVAWANEAHICLWAHDSAGNISPANPPAQGWLSAFG